MKKIILLTLLAFSFIGLSAQTTTTIYNETQAGNPLFNLSQKVMSNNDTVYVVTCQDQKNFGDDFTIVLKSEQAVNDFIFDISPKTKDAFGVSRPNYTVTEMFSQVGLWDSRAMKFHLISKRTSTDLATAWEKWLK